ncbi:MAG TPA: sigma-54 dependent transcriptional regulator [Vicinamibacterales bacterium]|nr:sigma-54 dependent transcriptional regulator [Vicinamibacterales bacterium]
MAAEASVPDLKAAAWSGVSQAFAALGRVFICLDRDFRVLHASSVLDDLLGPGSTSSIEGRAIDEILGADLFGVSGDLRQALVAGERREGWRALIDSSHGHSTLVSVTAAPFPTPRHGICDARVAFVIVLRPALEDQMLTTGAPTSFAGLVGRSPGMLRLFGLVQDLHHSDATVLITGESGTGKELLACAIHSHSPRRKGPFVAVNCAALPGDLLESELFGHIRGAFTGAIRDRVGRFEAAHGGTLFLDEIGDLPVHLQVKLLRAVQEHTFERVGETETRRTDARIIAATNVDLRRAVIDGRFREDLFYRLRVVPVEVPPLRERREDIEPVARHLLVRVSARHGRELRFSPDAVRAMLGYSWPGNVRELENAIEFGVAVCKGQTIQPEDLPAEVRRDQPAPSPNSVGPLLSDRPASEEADRLRAALEAHHWRRDLAARALGMSRSTLWRRIRELHIA